MISVIIPLYNAEKYILRALNSVYEQTEKDIEVIVVNDGSTDNSTQLIKDNFSNCILINQKNSGSSIARNTGIMQSRGDWIAFLDADDYWDNQKLKSQLKLANDNKFDMVLSNGFYIRHNKKIDLIHKNNDAINLNGVVNNKVKKIFHDASRYTISFPSCMLIKKDVVLKLGLFNEHLYHSGDYDLFLKAYCLSYKIGYMNSPLFFYELGNPNSLTKDVIDHVKQMEYCWDVRFKELILKFRPELYKDFIKTRYYVRSDMMYSLAINGFLLECLKMFNKQTSGHCFYFISILKGQVKYILKFLMILFNKFVLRRTL